MRSAAIIFAALLGARAFAGGGASIELLPQAEVRGAVVTLGQVARMQSPDLRLMQVLVDLPVAHAPRAGDESTLRRADVERWLLQAAVDPRQVTWRGPQQVRLRRHRTLVSGDSIALAAADALRRHLSAAGLRGEVLPASTPRDVHVPGADVRLHARSAAAGSLRRRSIVWVELWSDGAFVRSVPVSLEVQTGAGRVPGQALDAPASVVADPVRAGVPQRATPAPAVGRGEWAALRSTLGAVALESRVQVLQDGRPGDRIRVRQEGATGVVFARVLERGLLELAP